MASAQISANFFISYLASSLQQGGSENTIYLSTIKTLTGETIQTSDFQTFGRGTITIDPQSSTGIESAVFTGVDSINVAFTGVIRGLSAMGNDSSTSRMPYHPVGTLVIIAFGVHTMADIQTFVSNNTTAFKAYVDNAVAGSLGTASDTNAGTTKITVSPNITLTAPTITIASPAVVTSATHGLVANDSVVFGTSGNLPTGIISGNTYFVISTGLTTNTFEFSATRGGAAVNTSGTQSGTHTLKRTTATAVAYNDSQFVNYFADTGATNAYVITPSPAISAYATGQRFSFKAANANTSSSTLNVNGLGAQSITKDVATSLTANDISVGQIVQVEYDGTQFQMISRGSTLPGIIQMYAGASAPTGWLLCDGSAISRTTYATLFGVISTTYGAGDASTTFNVPDMRGRIPAGVGTGTGGGASGTGLPTGGSALTAVARGTWKGEELHTMTTNELVAHTHTMYQSSGAGGLQVATAGGGAYATTGSTGSTTPFNVIQPTMGVNFIIKT